MPKGEQTAQAHFTALDSKAREKNSNELESRTRRLQVEVFAKSFGPHKVTGGCSSAIQPRRVCSPEYGIWSTVRGEVLRNLGRLLRVAGDANNMG